MTDRERPMTAWDRLFAEWQEAISAHEIKRMQRHIEHLQATMGPHPTHSPQRPHERTSGEPAQAPLGGDRRAQVRGRLRQCGVQSTCRGSRARVALTPTPWPPPFRRVFVKPGTGARGCNAIRVSSKEHGILPPLPLCRPRATRPSMPVASLDVTRRTDPILAGHRRSL